MGRREQLIGSRGGHWALQLARVVRDLWLTDYRAECADLNYVREVLHEHEL